MRSLGVASAKTAAAVVTLPRNDKERAVEIRCGNYPCGAGDYRVRLGHVRQYSSPCIIASYLFLCSEIMLCPT